MLLARLLTYESTPAVSHDAVPLRLSKLEPPGNRRCDMTDSCFVNVRWCIVHRFWILNSKRWVTAGCFLFARVISCASYICKCLHTMVTAVCCMCAVCMNTTGPDCFRHYEFMLEGNIALVPDVYSMRRFMEGLPAFFFGGAYHNTRGDTASDGLPKC